MNDNMLRNMIELVSYLGSNCALQFYLPEEPHSLVEIAVE